MISFNPCQLFILCSSTSSHTEPLHHYGHCFYKAMLSLLSLPGTLYPTNVLHSAPSEVLKVWLTNLRVYPILLMVQMLSHGTVYLKHILLSSMLVFKCISPFPRIYFQGHRIFKDCLSCDFQKAVVHKTHDRFLIILVWIKSKWLYAHDMLPEFFTF